MTLEVPVELILKEGTQPNQLILFFKLKKIF